ncbi:hypothetical protein GEMRC1_008486 [Eukaryota sp. GEM-RC1]
MNCVSEKTVDELKEEDISENNPLKKRLPSEIRSKKRGGIKKRKKQLQDWKNSNNDVKSKKKAKRKWKKFNYTAGERAYDTKFKKYRKSENRKLKEFSIESPDETVTERQLKDFLVLHPDRILVTGRDVVNQFSNAVSNGERKSCFSDTFGTCVKEAERYNVYLSSFYEDDWFRKRKFQIYSNNQRSEKNMLERFNLIYGPPEDVVIGYGDWSSKGKTRKGKTSTVRGAEIRKMLRRYGYQIFLVDEYRTSKCCSKCAKEKSTFVECENVSELKVLGPKGKRQLRRKKRNGILEAEWEVKQKSLEEEAKSTPWGLVKCSDADCGTYWNRDLNSAINIYSIIEATINGQGRPSALERSKTQTTDLESGKDTLARDQKKKKTATRKLKTSTGKTRKKPTCGNCGQEGHNKTSCKNPPKEMSSPKRRSVKSVKKKKVSR